jgi:2-polyprenyl-3-methyl-5-hydroxy-6-metoxy-1,4-benzoquinol methylase
MLNYEIFARVYDTVMDSSLYEKWLKFVKCNLESQRNILELACGTGNLAIALANEGYQVTGFDLSEEMLSEAYQRALQEEVNVQWVQGDMRNLSQIGTYDVVTCFSDSICYMEDEQQVQQVFL